VAEDQGQPETEPSVESMAAEIAKGILQEEQGTPRDDKGKFTKAQPEAEAPKEQTEEPEAPTEEQTEEPAQPEVRKHKLTVKAEDDSDVEVEVDEEELKKGYMLEKSYRQKTAQLAREREQVQAKVKEAIEPKLKEYDEKLQMAEQVIWHTLAPEIQKTDWNALARDNPAEWAQKSQLRQTVEGQLAFIRSERQRIATENESKSKQAQQKAAEEALDTLKREIPGWNNDRYQKILQAGVDQYGFKQAEVNAFVDPRAIKVLDDARQWREFKAAKPQVDKRVTQAPKVVKPGAAKEPDSNADAWKQGMAKLQKSGGHTNAAVDLAKLYLAREQKQK